MPDLDVHHLKLVNWEWGQIYQFGELAVYECEEHHFFDQDKSLPNITLECLDTGNWSEYLPWHFCDYPASRSFNFKEISACLHDQTLARWCVEPPDPPTFEGYNGTSDWVKPMNLSWNEEVYYECPYAQEFVAETDPEKQNHVKKCQWDRSWAPVDVRLVFKVKSGHNTGFVCRHRLANGPTALTLPST